MTRWLVGAWVRVDGLRRRALVLEERAFDFWNRHVDRRISVTVGSALIVYGIGAMTKSVHTRMEFYAAVVQLMPVLMLVAAVNGRYFRERDAPPFDRFLIRGVWVVGLVGIAAALTVVACGRDSVLLRGSVIYALALVGVLATVYAIHGPARDADATQEGSGRTGNETH